MASSLGKSLTFCVRNSRYFQQKNYVSRFSVSASALSAHELNYRLDPKHAKYDPERAFLKKDVQKILYRVTGFAEERFNSQNRLTEMLELPIHRFLTVEEYEIEKTRGNLRARQKLKIPPVMAPRAPGGDVISAEPKLDKLLEFKLVFTDITNGVKDRDRVVVVRDVDGTLRNASWDEKMRLCQTYFPKSGREAFLPRVFQTEFLTQALKHVSATYLLNHACAQLEPDDPDYIRVTHAIYEDVDLKGTYEELHSTRMFGGLAFYLGGVARLDGLILDRLLRGRIADAADLVRLLNVLHPKCACALKAQKDKVKAERALVEIYIETMASKKIQDKLNGALERALETSDESDGLEKEAVAQ